MNHVFSEFYVFDCQGEELEYLIQSGNDSNVFTAEEKRELMRIEVIGHDLLIGMTLKLSGEEGVELRVRNNRLICKNKK